MRNAKTFAELDNVVTTAKALQVKFGPVKDVSDRAGLVWVRANRRLADELDKLPKATGTRGQLTKAGPGRGKKGKTGGDTMEPPVSDAPTLAELGVDKKRSARAASPSSGSQSCTVNRNRVQHLVRMLKI